MAYTSISSTELDIFHQPARLLISGFSGSGKTFLVTRLIEKYRERFSRIIVVGSDLDHSGGLNIERCDNFNPLIDNEINGHILIIYDDVLYNKKIIETAAEVFIRGRHLNISSIFLTQNIFFSNKHFRIISINTTHVILLRSRDIKQVKCFASSFLTDVQIESFIRLYKKWVMREKFKYVLIDFTKDIDSPLAIRKNIVNEDYEVAVSL